MTNNTFFYFRKNDNSLQSINTKCYACSLPINLFMPHVGLLVVHRHIAHPDRWSVTHAKTGLSVGKGKTRQSAIDNAHDNFAGIDANEVMLKITRHFELYADIYKAYGQIT